MYIIKNRETFDKLVPLLCSLDLYILETVLMVYCSILQSTQLGKLSPPALEHHVPPLTPNQKRGTQRVMTVRVMSMLIFTFVCPFTNAVRPIVFPL